MNYTKCPSVATWLIDTGRGHDLVPKREAAHTQRFIRKAGTISYREWFDSKGKNAAIVYITEVDDNITPYILENTPPALAVRYRCMDMDYSFIWPSGEAPCFIRLGGYIIRWMVEGYIPYLVPGDPRCKPCDPTSTVTFSVHYQLRSTTAVTHPVILLTKSDPSHS